MEAEEVCSTFNGGMSFSYYHIPYSPKVLLKPRSQDAKTPSLGSLVHRTLLYQETFIWSVHLLLTTTIVFPS